jgi:hypothetical protein
MMGVGSIAIIASLVLIIAMPVNIALAGEGGLV